MSDLATGPHEPLRGSVLGLVGIGAVGRHGACRTGDCADYWGGVGARRTGDCADHLGTGEFAADEVDDGFPAAFEASAAQGGGDAFPPGAEAVFCGDDALPGGGVVEAGFEADEPVVESLKPADGEQGGPADGEESGDDGGADDFRGDEDAAAGKGLAVGDEPEGDDFDGEEEQSGEEEKG